jgi:hypothetical protein
MRFLASGIVLLAVAALTGCGGGPVTGGDQVATEIPGAGLEAGTAQTPIDPPPPWRGESVPPVQRSDPDAAQPGDALSSQSGLRQRVAVRCRIRPDSVSEEEFLRALVAELYAEGAAPGASADALIRADCGGIDAIVRTLIAEGGEAAVVPVVDRTLLLVGPGARDIVEAAVSAGLQDSAQTRVSSPSRDLVDGVTRAYAMAYFPITDGDGGREESDRPTGLFQASRPGYGLYTYVMGADSDDPVDDASGLARHDELLRVIETYVLGARNGDSASDARAHVFLVPVHPRQLGLALAEQGDPQLSALMREALATQLRSLGQRELVRQLEESPGPALVTSLVPSMLPTGRDSAWLLVDLGAIGPAYMYSVVDAYDRPIPAEVAGRPESLAMVRERLLGLFPAPVLSDNGGNNGASPAGRWVFLLGDGPLAAIGGETMEAAPTPSIDTEGSR